MRFTAVRAGLVLSFVVSVVWLGTATAAGATGSTGPRSVGTAPSSGAGYWLAAADGGVFAFGSAKFYGSMGGEPLNAPIVGMAATPDRKGYWLVASDGGVFAFGDAQFYGSMGGKALNAPIVGMTVTPDGGGYWLVGEDGGVFTFGDAGFYGSWYQANLPGVLPPWPIIGIVPSSGGRGYAIVDQLGSLFGFAYFPACSVHSQGVYSARANVVAEQISSSNNGCWAATSTGGVLTYGDSSFYGSMVGKPLNAAVVDMATTADGTGYWLAAADGGVFAFGDAPFFGSMGGKPLNAPVVGIAAS